MAYLLNVSTFGGMDRLVLLFLSAHFIDHELRQFHFVH